MTHEDYTAIADALNSIWQSLKDGEPVGSVYDRLKVFNASVDTLTAYMSSANPRFAVSKFIQLVYSCYKGE